MIDRMLTFQHAVSASPQTAHCSAVVVRATDDGKRLASRHRTRLAAMFDVIVDSRLSGTM